MSIDLQKAVGFAIGSEPVAWNKRDLLLYAVGIGATRDDLSYVYELDNSFKAFPTYPVVLALKGASEDVNLFKDRLSKRSIPGLPKFDPNRVVHGSESIQVLKPLPLESGPGWKLERRVVGVHENKSGIVLDQETVLTDPQGTPYAKIYTSSFNVGARGTGEKFSKAIAGPPSAKPIPKDRAPDHVVREKTSTEQAIIYRLSGDYNPLHIDPRIGKAANFGGVILHGLSSFGFAARAILSEKVSGPNAELKLFGARFTSPVRPGDELETSVWEVGSGPNDTTEYTFVTKNVTTGKLCLGAGVAYVKKSEKSKL